MGDDNSENLESLKKILRDKGKILVFVGAGASIPLRIKGWHEILEEMEEEFTGEKGNLDEYLRLYGYAGTASKFYNAKDDQDFYRNFLFRQFTHTEGYFYSLQVAILNLFDTVLTTNYDTSFEEAKESLNDNLEHSGHPRLNYETQCLPRFSSSDLLLSPHIVYLHGNTDKKKYCFRKEEYKFYYPSVFENKKTSELEEFLREVIREFTVIFIGFSFNDAIFVEFFQNTIREYIERKIDFKTIHGEDDPRELPFKFVFHKNVVVQRSRMEKMVNDDSWKGLFVEPDENQLIFKTDADVISIVNGLKIDTSSKNEILKLYFKFKENIKDKDRLKDDLDLKIIGVNEYNEIELLLKDIRKGLIRPTMLEDTEGAANAD
ncbi:MAG: SIR2 family protein [Methanobacterium sp.]|jgi:NAD-dependent SIR2 family protein deacetylase